MLALQLIGGTVIFLDYVISRRLAAEPAFAAYLAFLILASAGLALKQAGARLVLAALKAALCFILLPFTPLPLFLLPAVFLELPGLFPGDRAAILLRAACACLPCAAAFLLPPALIPFYCGAWALSAFMAFDALGRDARASRLSARSRALERELSASEDRRAALEKSSVDRELLAQFQERDRIAIGLHDGLGHALSGGIMQLEAAGLLVREDPERAELIIGKARAALKEGLSELRLNLRGMKPEPSLLGLARLRAMLGEFESSYGRKTIVRTEGDPSLVPAALWDAIEGNLREALTNTLKHSDGRNFSCSISVLNQVVKAEFRDDGSARGAFRPGMGLEGMEARTRAAGGTLILDASRGFSVIMLFGRKGRDHGDTDTHR